MQQFLEYAQHHALLVTAAFILAGMVLVYELRLREQSTRSLSCLQAVRMINNGALIIDVRGKDDYEAGHIGEARHVPAAEVTAQAAELKKWRDKPIVTYCETGEKSAKAASELVKLGFAHAFNLAGGLERWRRDNMPLIKGRGK
jgi:rhodanese-related sulfurtransferase